MKFNKEKVAQCIKEKANWGLLKPEHKFDHKLFSATTTKEKLANASPKLKALLDKIKELDEKDMKEHGHLFKHFIYSDVKSSYGAKLIASGLTAAGFKHAYGLKQTPRGMSFTLNKLDGKSDTFATLTSVAFFEKPIGINFRKELLTAFNKRPDNNFGQNIRIMILDSGFREGIDLFDVKYVHLFEPIITKSDEKQAIGRATRFCGQKGLRFDPVAGWPLHVFRYETEITEDVKKYFALYDKELAKDTFFELFLQFSNIDQKKVTFANELEKVTIEAAVDKFLTKEIHEFKVPQTTGGTPSTTLTKAQKLQDKVAEQYSEFKWAKVKVENTCGTAGGATALSFTPTQEFVRRYFTPRYPNPGMLLYHSVGTGKLCTAISTLTSTFEPEGYTILYVTRYTLKSEVWKNVFDQTCSLIIQAMLKEGKSLPEAQAAKLRLLSKGWFEPMSYRQLSNLIAGKNKLSEKLHELNGTEDPLRKTVIVIDEAHKLFAADVEGQEKADMDVLKEAFMHSNKVSGKDGVKLLFMTATPYTSEPMDMMKLLNLIRPVDDQLPETFEDFAKEYLDETGAFTVEGKRMYHNKIAGYISYLNRERDIRSFSYPIVKDIHVPMSKYEYLDILTQFSVIKEKYSNANRDLIQNKGYVLQEAEKYRKKLEEELQADLKEKYDEHLECVKSIKLDIDKYKKAIQNTFKNALKQCKDQADEEIKQIKEEYKQLIKDIRKETKGKSKEEKEKAKAQIENLKLDQVFDIEQVYLNPNMEACQKAAEEVYQKALQNIPINTTQEQCDALMTVIKETEAAARKEFVKLVEEFKEAELATLKVDEDRVKFLKQEYNRLAIEKQKAIQGDVSQQTGLEKCFAPKVKPMVELIERGDSILDTIDEEETEPEEVIDEALKQNIYLISGHGGEKVVNFDRRKKMPNDKVLVVFPVCARPNFMDSGCKFIEIMNDPANKKFIQNPIKYKKELVRLLNRPIRIYLPGEYVPQMSTNLFLDFNKGNKVVIAKSGVFRVYGVKKMDRTIMKEAKQVEEQLGSPLCKPVIGVINSPMDYNSKVHKEVFSGNVYKPASKKGTYNYLRYRSFEVDDILKETGPGIYYYIGCRVSNNPVEPEAYVKVLDASEKQQDTASRVKKIEPVLPFIKKEGDEVTPVSSTKTSSTEKEKPKTEVRNKELIKIEKEIKQLFKSLSNVATKIPEIREKLGKQPKDKTVENLLKELTILEELDRIKDTAKVELQVKTVGNQFQFNEISTVKLNSKKYTFNPVIYGFIPSRMRDVSEKCSAGILKKKIVQLYKRGVKLELPKKPVTDSAVFTELCKKVKLI